MEKVLPYIIDGFIRVFTESKYQNYPKMDLLLSKKKYGTLGASFASSPSSLRESEEPGTVQAVELWAKHTPVTVHDILVSVFLRFWISYTKVPLKKISC